jgi:hypothetical protein
MSEYDNDRETPAEQEERGRRESTERLKGFHKNASELLLSRARPARSESSFWDRLEWTYYGRW